MGLGDFFRRIFSGGESQQPDPWGRSTKPLGDPSAPAAEVAKPVERVFGRRRDCDELARRLGSTVEALESFRPAYRTFKIPKRSGGQRVIAAPDDALKTLQRTILYKLLGRLKAHPCAHGFERKRSIVTNASPHTGRAVLVRMDLQDFFPSTTAERIRKYFEGIGWDRKAAKLLVKLTTLSGGLPQGAPTSPRLSNLVNTRMDARLAGVARRYRARYTRYADDMTFSFEVDKGRAPNLLIALAKSILAEDGYRVHLKKKLHIRRRHQRQDVTGLVVNERVNLPRRTRHKLRAVAHHLATGRPATLTEAQLAGWKALVSMVNAQRSGLSASAPK